MERKQEKASLCVCVSALCSNLITYNYKVVRCETLIENFGCLRLSLRRICVPIWLIGKGFYFLDH